MRFSKVLATGSYVPSTIIENQDFQQFPKNSLSLIEKKTGVRQRRRAASTQCTSDLGIEAARNCLERAGISPLDLDGVLLSTSSPDRIQPATAGRIQAALGASQAFACDINAVCSGALYALHFADGLIRAGTAKYVLVIAAELYSRILNSNDFSTYPYFGDGSGAVLLGASERPGIILTQLGADGLGADLIQIPAGGSMMPYSKMERPEDQYFTMQGRAVFQFAVSRGAQALREVLVKTSIQIEDVDHFVLHQANINILYAIADELGAPRSKFALNLDTFGNTASASVLIALDDVVQQNRNVNSAEKTIALAAFGGGLTWGAAVIKI